MPRANGNCRKTMGAILLLLAAGCDGAAPPTLVRGKVLYQGMPLPGGTIVFAPDVSRGETGSLARSEIRPDGTYSLRTGDSDDVAPGWYRITLVSSARVTVAAADGRPATRALVPEKYRDPDTSGLGCRIEAGRTNEFNIDLR